MRSRRFGTSRSVLWCWLLVTTAVWGQDQQQQAKGFNVTVNSELSYDDNILRQQTNKTGSRLWQFNPKLKYTMQAAGGTYNLGFDINHNNYLDSSRDTYTSETLVLGVDQKLDSSNKLMFSGSYNHTYEARGVGFNEGENAQSLSSPTPLVSKEVAGKYQLGADKARMRFIGSMGYRSYDRNSQAIINDSRDYHEDLLGAEMDYRVGSRTDLVVEWRDRETSYARTPVAADGTEIPLDSDEQLYLIGLDLEATAKTTGKLRVGSSKRDFKWKAAQWDDAKTVATVAETTAPAAVTPQFPADPGAELYWELSAIWSPRSYSKFELNTRSSTREALGVGSFIRSKDYTLSWTHQWRNRVRSRLEFSIGSDAYVGSSRVDDRRAYNLKMEYDFDDLLSFGFGYRYQQMSSTAGALGFDKSMYYIFANYRSKKGI